MWRRIALPVIVVGVSWLTVSGGTTYYLKWLHASYDRVFDENISSIRASGQVQREVWLLYAEVISKGQRETDRLQRLRAFEKAIRDPLAILINHSTTIEEHAVAERLGQLTKKYHDEVEGVFQSSSAQSDTRSDSLQAELLQLVMQISSDADRVCQINEHLLELSDVNRDRVSLFVLWARALAIAFVPVFGIAVGWWTANRLQRSIAQIQVTLHDPTLAVSGMLGTVQVESGDELTLIRQQVEAVVDRLQHTNKELQAARYEVVRGERLAAIGRLAAGVAHELRNPLTSVKLLLQHAASRSGDAVVPSSRMALILDEILRMEATVQALLDFSRPAPPQRRLHDLRVTLERAVRLVEGRAEKQQIDVDQNLGATPAMLNGDPQQLQQVVVNLLINGIEAMPDGGTLSVAMSRDSAKDFMVIEIGDTGIGIPPELLPRLFEPFATSKEQGTGLGLAISRRIVEEHGGSMEVRHRSPRGTAFVITIPINCGASVAG